MALMTLMKWWHLYLYGSFQVGDEKESCNYINENVSEYEQVIIILKIMSIVTDGIITTKNRRQVFMILQKKMIVKAFNDNDCNYRLVLRTVMIITVVTSCHDKSCECKTIVNKIDNFSNW